MSLFKSLKAKIDCLFSDSTTKPDEKAAQAISQILKNKKDIALKIRTEMVEAGLIRNSDLNSTGMQRVLSEIESDREFLELFIKSGQHPSKLADTLLLLNREHVAFKCPITEERLNRAFKQILCS